LEQVSQLAILGVSGRLAQSEDGLQVLLPLDRSAGATQQTKSEDWHWSTPLEQVSQLAILRVSGRLKQSFEGRQVVFPVEASPGATQQTVFAAHLSPPIWQVCHWGTSRLS
jgi:hypothetical protein